MQIQCNELLLGPDIEDLYWEPVYYLEVLISELTWNSFLNDLWKIGVYYMYRNVLSIIFCFCQN